MRHLTPLTAALAAAVALATAGPASAAPPIEQQRWDPIAKGCVPSVGGFGWSNPLGSSQHPSWQDAKELEQGWMLFNAEYRDGWIAGAVIDKACTQFNGYPDAWTVFSSTPQGVEAVRPTAFDGKPGRIIDIDVYYDGIPVPANKRHRVIFAPNYGPAYQASWWGHGATAADLTKLINGQAWANFAADGIPKRIVSIDREFDGRYSFVLTKWKPGEAWWWGPGATQQELVNAINGQGDGIAKRLVALIPHGDGHFTSVLVPWKAGVGFWWKPNATWSQINSLATSTNSRIVDLERYGASNDHYSAVLVGNT